MLLFKIKGVSTKRALIFLHGFLGQKEDFDETISYLEDIFYCVSLDLTTTETNSPFQQIVFEILKVIRHLQLKDPVLIGYSMGGRIAHIFQQISNISCQSILIGSHLGLNNVQEKKSRLHWEKEIEKKLNTLSINTFIENWYQQPIFSSFQTHPCFQSILKKRKKQEINALKKLFLSFQLTKQPAYPPHVLSYFFCGQYDDKYIQYYRKEKICFDIVNKAGHVVHLENPQELAKKIKEVLYGNKLEIRR